MSWNEHRKKILEMSNSEIISDVIRNPIADEEVKQIARDELLIRIIGKLSK